MCSLFPSNDVTDSQIIIKLQPNERPPCTPLWRYSCSRQGAAVFVWLCYLNKFSKKTCHRDIWHDVSSTRISNSQITTCHLYSGRKDKVTAIYTCYIWGGGCFDIPQQSKERSGQLLHVVTSTTKGSNNKIWYVLRDSINNRGDYTISPRNFQFFFVTVITFFPFLLCK